MRLGWLKIVQKPKHLLPKTVNLPTILAEEHTVDEDVYKLLTSSRIWMITLILVREWEWKEQKLMLKPWSLQLLMERGRPLWANQQQLNPLHYIGCSALFIKPTPPSVVTVHRKHFHAFFASCKWKSAFLSKCVSVCARNKVLPYPNMHQMRTQVFEKEEGCTLWRPLTQMAPFPFFLAFQYFCPYKCQNRRKITHIMFHNLT